MSDPQLEPYDEVDTRTVTRRYRRPPGGWWWGAFAGVPLALALLGTMGQDDAAPASTSAAAPTTTITAPAATVTADPTSTGTDGGATPSASGTTVTMPADGTASASASGSTTSGTAAPTTTATTTAGATPTATATTTIDPSSIRCDTFTKDVAGVLAANKITFTSGGSQLTGTSRQTIGAVATALRGCDTTGVVVTGYTDNTGNEAKNKALSAARAAAVRSALVADGVAPSRIASVGAGSARPVASNDSDAGRAQNRRVEIVAN